MVDARSVTHSDLLEAVAEALEAATTEDGDAGGALRTVEIMEELGLSRDRTIKLLHNLLDAGRLEETTKRMRRLGGNVVRVNAYRLIPTDGE